MDTILFSLDVTPGLLVVLLFAFPSCLLLFFAISLGFCSSPRSLRTYRQSQRVLYEILEVDELQMQNMLQLIELKTKTQELRCALCEARQQSETQN